MVFQVSISIYYNKYVEKKEKDHPWCSPYWLNPQGKIQLTKELLELSQLVEKLAGLIKYMDEEIEVQGREVTHPK